MSATNKHRRQHRVDVPDERENTRIDQYLSEIISDYSRSYLKKLVQEGYVSVNAVVITKPSFKLSGGDQLFLTIPEPVEVDISAEDIPLDIKYEDEHLLVINKPAGMVVHPGAGVHNGTLVNALMYHCKDLSGVGGRLRPGIVHRLDKNTSGLLVVAKNDRAHIVLQNQFADKSAGRIYKALVWGNISEDDGRIETFIERSKSDRKKFAVAPQGKSAVTLFRVSERFSWCNLVEIELKTGRTHQIRVHFNAMHHPVFGDPDYSGRKKQLNRLSSLSERNFAVYLLKKINRQALHAGALTLVHPHTGKTLRIVSDLPNDITGILMDIRRREE